MSGVNVPPRSNPTYLRRLRVGQPVSALHAQDWTGEALFQSAGLGCAVADCTLNIQAFNNGAFDISCAYARSPGAQALLVWLEFNNTFGAHAAGHFATITTTLGGSAAVFIGDAHQLDGSAPIAVPPPGLRDPGSVHATVDVTGLPSDGTIVDINFHVVPGGAGAYSVGVRRVHVVEVPLANALPDVDPINEPGLTPGFALANGRIMDGSVATGTGFVRGTDQWLDAPRYRRRNHINWCSALPVLANTASTSFANLDWCADHTYWSAAYVPVWKMRARRVYSTSTGNAYTFRITYQCAAASGGKVRLIVNGTNHDFTFGTASGYTTAAFALSIPTNTTNQEVTLQLQALTSDATKTFFLRNWALVEAEV